jgi:ABC-type glycerol-3-phosphate transport system permease component
MHSIGKKKQYFISESVKHLFIWLVLGFSLFPLYMVFNISFKDNTQFYNQPWLPTLPLHFENWTKGWDNIGETIANSIFLSVSATVLALAFGISAAYFFARCKMPGWKIFWAIFMVLMLMPGVANLIPLFSLLKNLNLLNTYFALIILGTSGGQVVTIYILRNFIEEIPKDLFESAQMDGAGHLQQIIHIVIPFSGSIISTLAILRFIFEWNSFILPLIILRDETRLPMAVKLYQIEGAYVQQWGPMMASYAIASIPLILLFLFTMQFFIKGLSSGAVKG